MCTNLKNISILRFLSKYLQEGCFIAYFSKTLSEVALCYPTNGKELFLLVRVLNDKNKLCVSKCFCISCYCLIHMVMDLWDTLVLLILWLFYKNIAITLI